MSTTPIPSALVEDFKLNVEDFDAFANGTVTYTDRFGSSRLSLSQFMESIGYEVPVAFADALSITRVTQTVTYSGNTYHARADAIPFNTTVTFNPAQWDLIVSNPVEVSTHAAASKSTPVDADEIPLVDSEASFGLKRLTWANLKAGIFSAWGALINAGVSKATPVDADAFAFMDSAAANATKKLTWSNLKATLFSGFSMTGLLKFAAGANIASAATVNLSTATGNTVHITGTTGISAWTMTAGQVMDVIFDGILILTHNATTNNLNNAGNNITTAANDRARIYYDGATVWFLNYTRANGKTLFSPDVLTRSYTSPEQTITAAGGLTLAHGLGVKPAILQYTLVCKTADGGYSVGDELNWMTVQYSPSASSISSGFTCVADSTNLFIKFGSSAVSFYLLNKTSGAVFGATSADWRLIVKAYA